jgi:hypothetical protein
LFVSLLPRGECAAYASTAQIVRGGKNIRYRIALHARDYWMLAPMGKPGPLYATFCPGYADVRVAVVKLSTIRHHYLLPNEPPWLYDWGIKLRVIRFP